MMLEKADINESSFTKASTRSELVQTITEASIPNEESTNVPSLFCFILKYCLGSGSDFGNSLNADMLTARQ